VGPRAAQVKVVKAKAPTSSSKAQSPAAAADFKGLRTCSFQEVAAVGLAQCKPSGLYQCRVGEWRVTLHALGVAESN